MNPPQSSTTQDSSKNPPNTKDNAPLDGISGVYSISNPSQTTYLPEHLYVLSYEGFATSAWPEKNERYDGIIGSYLRSDNAQRVGNQLIEQPASNSDGSVVTGSRIGEWEVKKETGNWEKEKAWNGPLFLESRLVRINKCEVLRDGSLPKGRKFA